jgi:uncharacterized protein (TIGR00369 family)
MIEDTSIAISQMPRKDDPHEAWLSWANEYATLRASRMVCIRIDHEGAEFVLEENPFPLNPNGAVNGGVVSLAVDQAMGVVAIRAADTGSAPVTAVLQVNFHRPAFGPLTLRARRIPGGRNISTVEVSVDDRDGQLCATAMGTMATRRSTADNNSANSS